MVKDLLDACAEVDSDLSVGAVVIKAEGESFCAGAHRATLAAAGADPALDQNYSNLRTVYSAFGGIGQLKVPTIAAVRGHAVGAGVNLMLATDLRIVATTARIITGFLRIGIHPGGGHFSLLNRVAGREAAAAMSLFGQEISGLRAAEIGLAWEALPEPEVEPRAVQLAEGVAADPELARAVVRAFRLSTGPPAISWPVALEAETAAQMWSLRRRKSN
jgi:enoyl-CoA hydratase